MTHMPGLSVVVTGHGRPGALRRCLLALSQATLPVEAIVVADAPGLAAAARLPFAHRLKTALQPDPARARNDGIVRAASEIVAFLDADAVPEPTWPGAILAGFAAEPRLVAVTGPVIGSDAQGCLAVDRTGRETPFPDPAPGTVHGAALKLHAANMAVRRGVLMALGGFDPALQGDLAASDLSLRLAAQDHGTAWLAGAQVHLPGPVPRADNSPGDLQALGTSSAAFLRKHAPEAMADALAALVDEQRARLFRLARKRRLGPREIERLMADLHHGIAEGRGRVSDSAPLSPRDTRRSAISEGVPRPDAVLAGWRFRSRRLRAEARRLTEDGTRVTLFLFEPTFRPRRTRYTDGGWWEETAGLFGSGGGTPILTWRRAARLQAELRRLDTLRFDETPVVRFIAG
jgi:hypothetical protein